MVHIFYGDTEIATAPSYPENNIYYDGHIIATLAFDDHESCTILCQNKSMKSDIVIGRVRLNCAMMRMLHDVSISIDNTTAPLTQLSAPTIHLENNTFAFNAVDHAESYKVSVTNNSGQDISVIGYLTPNGEWIDGGDDV